MKKLKIHQLGKIISGGTPSTTNENYWDGEVIWITPKDLSKNKSRYIYNGERNITQAGLEHSSAKLLPANSVLLSSRAPIGYLAIAGCELTTNQGFKSVICDESIVLPEYLYYSLSTKIDDLISISSGSTFLELSKSSFENFELNIHSIQEQQHIVNIIGSIDDLIESNTVALNNIESLINNIFNAHYILWKEKRELGKVFTCILGGTPSTKNVEYWNGDIPWINSGEVNNLRISAPTKYITKLGLEKSATKLLPTGTTVIAITGATLGQVSLLEIDSCANQSVIGILENKEYKRDYIYPLMNKIIKELMLNQTGGAQQHINKNDVQSFIINIPNIQQYEEYTKIVLPLLNHQSMIVKQNNKLTNLKQKYLNKFFG